MSSLTVDPNPRNALLDAPEAAQSPNAPMIVRVAQACGVSPVRQMREIFAMRGGVQKLGSDEYYKLGLFDPGIAMDNKRAFLGQLGVNEINTAMNPPIAVPTRAFVGNKLLYTQLLTQIGIPSAPTQALVSTHRTVGQVPVLRDADAIVTFLLDQAMYPIFGKPHHGSLSEGSVRIDRFEGETLILGDGSTRDIRAFAEEVMGKFAGGYLLQSALLPHADMAAIAGPSVGCVRIVTANDGSGPRAAYALWKLPAAHAMSDNFWQVGSLLAHVDLQTGRTTTCVQGTGLDTRLHQVHPLSGQPVVDICLPHWEQTVRTAELAHAVFPEFGVCGFDIAITDEGPRVIECNDNPSHGLYQMAARRGLRNGDLAPIWDAVIARQKKQVARLKAGSKKRR